MQCPEVSPDDYADYLKEMISGFPFSKIATQDARESPTDPPTTYPLFNDWWHEVVPGNVDQVLPVYLTTSLPPTYAHSRTRSLPFSFSQPLLFPSLLFSHSHFFFPRPLSLFEETPEVSNSSLKPPLDSGSDRKKRRGNKKPPPPQPGKEKWNQDDAVQWLCEKGITSMTQYDKYRRENADVPAEMPSNPVTFYKARDGT